MIVLEYNAKFGRRGVAIAEHCVQVSCLPNHRESSRFGTKGMRDCVAFFAGSREKLESIRSRNPCISIPRIKFSRAAQRQQRCCWIVLLIQANLSQLPPIRRILRFKSSCANLIL
jgi:hypothetical protein